MGYFPIFLEMSERLCLVIGGGAVAERKVGALLNTGALVTVISPKLTERLLGWVGTGKIQNIAREYQNGDLTGYQMVFVATEKNDVNKAVAQEGRNQRVWVNAADDPANCDFILPSVLRRGDLTVAVGTGGASPAVSKMVREELEESIGHEYAELARIASEVRQELKNDSCVPSAEAWGKALRGDVRRLIREDRPDEAKVLLRKQLTQGFQPDVQANRGAPVADPAVGKVYLVGAGPGHPDLLTVRARDLLLSADVVVYDRLVNPELVEQCSRNTGLIYVGKEAGHHLLPQEEINHVLVAQAHSGHSVVRLKGGDPFVFGRGGEEAQALAEAGVPFEIVPGVTSAVAVPAYAGIPLTYRRVSSSFAVITGHESVKSSPSVDWSGLATAVDTLVVVMGLSNLAHIVAQLLTHGRPPETPIALIRLGTTDRQETVTGTLATICEQAVGLKPPVLAVIGEVVRLREELCWFDELGATVAREERPLDGVTTQVQP